MTRDDWKRVEPVLTRAALLPEGERDALIAATVLDSTVRLRIIGALDQNSTRWAIGPAPAAPPSPIRILSRPRVPVLSPGDALEGRRFVVVRQIGRGGMGDVYLAQDTTLGTLVALKILPSDEHLITEAQRAAVCSDHPNVVTIHNVLRASFKGQPVGVLVMDYVVGTSAGRLLNDGPVELTRALRWMREIAAAIAHAHDCNVLHCDLKPANVLITPDDHAVVLDFGIARATFDAASETEPLRGTLPYMAPEQLLARVFSPAGDIYSLGVTLFELVTGQRPFQGDHRMLPVQIAAAPPPRVSELVPGAPLELEAVIERALAKEPDDRFRSVRAFDKALEDIETQLTPLRAKGTALADSGRRPAVRPSIAVLPFANLTPDPDAEYFGDGLTEELINTLSQIEGLRVISRTSAFELKRQGLDVRAIGQQLGVETVLEGSVRKSGNRLRITAGLASVSDGCQIWATRFDRTMADVFDIQDEIAQTIGRTLRVKFSCFDGKPVVNRPTQDIEAYHLYLRGRFHWNKRSSDGFEKSREFFSAALARDPRFALAHAGLADYYISLASWGLAAPDSAWPDAYRASMRALEIDPALADAHVALAAYRTYYEWNWIEGEQEFRRARQLASGDVNACVQYAAFLMQRGRAREARAEIERALELDPLSPSVNTGVAAIAYYSRQYDRAVDLCGEALDIARDDIEALCILGLTREARGEFKEAVQAFEQARDLSCDNPLVLAALAAAYANARELAAASDSIGRLRSLAQSTYVAPIAWAWVHLASGELESAIEWFDRAAEAHDPMLCYLPVAPTYDRVRGDPRVAALLDRIGLGDVDLREIDASILDGLGTDTTFTRLSATEG